MGTPEKPDNPSTRPVEQVQMEKEGTLAFDADNLNDFAQEEIKPNTRANIETDFRQYQAERSTNLQTIGEESEEQKQRDEQLKLKQQLQDKVIARLKEGGTEQIQEIDKKITLLSLRYIGESLSQFDQPASLDQNLFHGILQKHGARTLDEAKQNPKTWEAVRDEYVIERTVQQLRTAEDKIQTVTAVESAMTPVTIRKENAQRKLNKASSGSQRETLQQEFNTARQQEQELRATIPLAYQEFFHIQTLEEGTRAFTEASPEKQRAFREYLWQRTNGQIDLSSLDRMNVIHKQFSLHEKVMRDPADGQKLIQIASSDLSLKEKQRQFTDTYKQILAQQKYQKDVSDLTMAENAYIESSAQAQWVQYYTIYALDIPLYDSSKVTSYEVLPDGTVSLQYKPTITYQNYNVLIHPDGTVNVNNVDGKFVFDVPRVLSHEEIRDVLTDMEHKKMLKDNHFPEFMWDGNLFDAHGTARDRFIQSLLTTNMGTGGKAKEIDENRLDANTRSELQRYLLFFTGTKSQVELQALSVLEVGRRLEKIGVIRLSERIINPIQPLRNEVANLQGADDPVRWYRTKTETMFPSADDYPTTGGGESSSWLVVSPEAICFI